MFWTPQPSGLEHEEGQKVSEESMQETGNIAGSDEPTLQIFQRVAER